MFGRVRPDFQENLGKGLGFGFWLLLAGGLWGQGGGLEEEEIHAKAFMPSQMPPSLPTFAAGSGSPRGASTTAAATGAAGGGGGALLPSPSSFQHPQQHQHHQQQV